MDILITIIAIVVFGLTLGLCVWLVRLSKQSIADLKTIAADNGFTYAGSAKGYVNFPAELGSNVFLSNWGFQAHRRPSTACAVPVQPGPYCFFGLVIRWR